MTSNCVAKSSGRQAILFLLAIGALLRPATSQESQETRLLADPAISNEHVAFVYAEDLWVCAKSGGEARRLTSHIGTEMRPCFSPDGKWIAFSGQYDGNIDVFVVSVRGGEPRRLTWHPGSDLVQDFHPDGSRVLFTSSRSSYTRRYTQLFEVQVDGGFPEQLAVPNASKACYSPDGTQLAYQPLRDAFGQWKHYRGGTTARLWLYDRKTHSVEQIPQPEGRCNDTTPMWVGPNVFFRSDRDGEFQLYAFDTKAKKIRQLTQYQDFPVLAADAHKQQLVFEQAGWLHMMDLLTGSSKRLAIHASADPTETRSRWASGNRWLRSADISPSGKRAVVAYRGEILTLPADKGDPRNLTNTPGAHEHSPAWSPDGSHIAYVSDAGGEYQLHVAAQRGGAVRSYPLAGAGHYNQLQWSPDGKKMTFVDNARVLSWIDLTSGKVTRIGANDVYGPGFEPIDNHWSPDSRTLAYTRMLPTNLRQVFVYSIDDARSHAITDGLSDVHQPRFDANGKYLYLVGSTDAGPVRQWFAMSNADMEMHQAIYVAVLQKGEVSPLRRRSDEEPAKEGSDSDSDGDADESSDKGEEEIERIAIDFEGLQHRILDLPIPTTQITQIATGASGKLFYLQTGAGPSSLKLFDLDTRKSELVATGVINFRISADNKKLLVRTAEGVHIVDATAGAKLAKGKLALERVRVRVEPRAEWQQIFDEAWRINRDWFYDPGMHGADWPAMKVKYRAFVPHIAVRSDLNRVIRWMCSELVAGHHRVGGGERLHQLERVPVGLLGADFEVHNQRYRVAKVFGGLNWNPNLRAPLTEPGVDVQAGEYLLAVDSVALVPPDNLFSRFEHTIGRIIELTVGPNADGTGSRTVRVEPIASEASLRNRDWVEGNLKRVHEATDGRVAYVHVPNTSNQGHEYFKRYFFPQADKQAIIVDERHNGGGQIADYYIDLLSRKPSSWWTTRYGRDFQGPLSAIAGPKVLLVDETAGSGGDLFPYMWRRAGLGPIVGKTTWGGLIGVLGFPTLMDGGNITAPNLGFWNEDGFRIENEGVAPDIEVEQLPAKVIAGEDPQLERAIQETLRMLQAKPPKPPKRPAFPVRVRKD